MYVKLFGTILHSSIWDTDLATRVVWITMLAMADEYGIVHAGVRGLAREANVSERETRRALKVLLAPDKLSGSPTAEGRRIEPIDGGWHLINYQKYREIRTKKQLADAMRQRRRYEHLKRDTSHTSQEPHAPHTTLTHLTTEAEAEAEAEKSKPSAAQRATWLTPFGEAWTRAYGGEPAFGELAKYLRPLLEGRATEEVLAHWTRYLRETEAQYVSPARFAQTYGKWAPPTHSVVWLPSADELDARAGIPVPKGPA